MKGHEHCAIHSNYISHWLTREKKRLKNNLLEKHCACLHLIADVPVKERKTVPQISSSVLDWKITKETVQENDLNIFIDLHFIKCRENKHFLGGGGMALTGTEFRTKIRIVFHTEGLFRSNSFVD